MANWDILKSAIAGIIKTNGNQEITGQLLQNVLNNIVSSVGENATFAGIATPTTNPGAPDGPVFYLATQAGVYANFSGFELKTTCAAILWDGNEWKKIPTGIPLLDTSYNMYDRLIGWDNIPDNDGAIYNARIAFGEGTYKAFRVNEGDSIAIRSGEAGSYMAFVTSLPTSESIPLAPDESNRRVIGANSYVSNIIVPNGTAFVIVESSRIDEDTKPKGLLINGYDMFKNYIPDIISSVTSKSNIGIFSPHFGSKVNITEETITIPANSRIFYNGKEFYQNSDDVILERSISAQAEFVVFNIKEKAYSILEYGTMDISDGNLIFCFFVRNRLAGCSLSTSLYTANGINIYEKRTFGVILPPSNAKIVVTKTQITIPALTRLYYDGKVHRIYNNDVIVERIATGAGTGWTEELLVFDENTSEFKCIGGGGYSEEYTSSMVIICGLKTGNNGTTLSPQITSTNYISKLCVAFGKKVNITDTTITIPSNSRIYYNHNSYYSIATDLTFEREYGAQHQFIMFDCVSKELYITGASGWPERTISSYPLFWVSYTNGCSLSASLYTINGKPVYESSEEKTGILDFNPKVEVESKLIPQTANKSNSLLTLLHFSDLHSSSVNLQRIVEFRNEYSGYIDDSIHTGDTVNGIITDTNPFETVSGAENILNVIGNHEAWLSTDIPDYTATEKQCYDKIFAPSISNWGVTQPENAESDGKCYYYKDYVDANIRLIVLDSVHWHTRNGVMDDATVQKAWFVTTLEDAKSKGLTVVAAMHYPPVNGIDLVKNTGFTRYSKNDTEIWGDGWYASDEIFTCVDDFITSGGKFATWLIGHTHYDICGQVHSHNGQFMVVIQSCYRSWDENMLVAGTKTQDAFNIITIESSNTTIKITRIGNDADSYMQSKKTLCYDYGSKELIYNT